MASPRPDADVTEGPTRRVALILRAVDPVAPLLEAHRGAWPEPPEGALHRREPHLLQWVVVRDGGVVEGHYLFDERYVAAHPESVDARHLSLLHALLSFKLFDDGEVLVPPEQVAGSLRWPGTDERRRPLGGGG